MLVSENIFKDGPAPCLTGWWSPGSFRTLEPRAQNTPGTFSISQGHANSAKLFFLPVSKSQACFCSLYLTHKKPNFTLGAPASHAVKIKLIDTPWNAMPKHSRTLSAELGWVFSLGAVLVMEKANPLHLTSEILHLTPCIFSNFLWEYKEGIFKTDKKKQVLLVENCQDVCRKINCSRLILSGN